MLFHHSFIFFLSYAEFLTPKHNVPASRPPLYQPVAISRHTISKLWEKQQSFTDSFWRHM